MTLVQVWEARVYTTSIARLGNTETFVSLAHDTREIAADAAELTGAERTSAEWAIED